MERITLRLPDNLLLALRARAAEEHRDIANMARRILSLALEAPETEELDATQNPELPLT